MHFSIPETQEYSDDSGPSYTGYHIFINGKFHCIVRYRQLYSLNDQLKKEYGAAILPYFPPKKFLPLSSNQLEERRSLLEKYIQKVGQHPDLVSSEIVNSFLLSAQLETSEEKVRETTLEVFLMNGYNITVTVLTNERSHKVLEKVCSQINLPDAYVYYFYLFLMKNEDGDITIVRKLQDFESPYLSQKSIPGSHKIVLRKNYWDPAYDIELITDRVALNLLYVQTVSEVENGWILCGEESRQQLTALQAKGAKREYMEVARSLKFYGCVSFTPCMADYPFPSAPVIINVGNYELNIQLQTGDRHHLSSTSGGNFKVTRIRCWRITTLHDNVEDGNSSGPDFELSFEYLVARDKLIWITISSQQAILISLCLQSMVDELLLKRNGSKRKMPGETHQKQNWLYMKRDGSSQIMSSSQSSSSDTFTSSLSSTSSNLIASASNGDSASPTKTESTSSSIKRFSEKFSSVSLKSSSSKSQSCSSSHQTVPVENNAFDGIGDEDL